MTGRVGAVNRREDVEVTWMLLHRYGMVYSRRSGHWKGHTAVKMGVKDGGVQRIVQNSGYHITIFNADAMLSDPLPTPFMHGPIPNLPYYSKPSSPYSISI